MLTREGSDVKVVVHQRTIIGSGRLPDDHDAPHMQIAKGNSHGHNTFFTSELHFDDSLGPAEVRPGSAARRRHNAATRRR
jgi:hypothetical protein